MATTHTATPQAAPPMVEIRKLWTVFGKGEQAFSVHQDLDLDVYKGEVLTLVGELAATNCSTCEPR